MSLFTAPKIEEIVDLKERNKYLEGTVEKLERRLNTERDEYQFELKKQEFKVEKAVFDKVKTMQASLVESDLLRAEAVAKYNAYVEMDTKDDREHNRKMLEKAIEALGKIGTKVGQVSK